MKLIDKIPPMLTDEWLIKTLEKYPTYHNPQLLSKSKRLIHAQDIFDIYVPNVMSIDLYTSFYFLLLQACKRKEEGLGFHSINNETILVCADAGRGKSETIARINEVIFHNQIIELEQPYTKVIPILVVQCSTISSFKGYLVSILYAIDSRIGTNYGTYCNKNSINTDELLIACSKALDLHVLVLVSEEMSFLNETNRGMSFANQIVALSNIINCSIVFVCVPIGLRFFASSDYLARRSLTKIYKGLDYEEVEKLIRELLKYNYTLKEPSINQELIRSIFNVTNGNPALIKQVIVASQTWAIQSDYEKLDIHSIKMGIESKLTTMQPYLGNGPIFKHQRVNEEKAVLRQQIMTNEEFINLFKKASEMAQKQAKNAIAFLSQFIDVESVTL